MNYMHSNTTTIIPTLDDRILGVILVWAEYWMGSNSPAITLRPRDLAVPLNVHSKRAGWGCSFSPSSVSRWINTLISNSIMNTFEGITITRETSREPKRNGDGTQSFTQYVFTKQAA